MKTALCLQHVPFEGPGILQPILGELGYRVERRLVPREGLPQRAGDFLLIMGGPMSVNDGDAWIAAETEFVREAMATGMPMLGICLGSQIMAKAIGGSVAPGPQPEIGMTALRRTAGGAEDPSFRHFPDVFEAFEWHGEGVALPPGHVPLASSPLFPVQAFRATPRAYGFLFHVEIEQDGVALLCRHGESDLARARMTAQEVEETAGPHFPLMQGYLAGFVRSLLA